MAFNPGSEVGSYTLGRELGRGGMGVVFLARDTRLERDVAIKTMPDEVAQDAQRLARFEREARTLAQLNHPNVAAIYGLEQEDEHRYLVLEYVEGDTLADLLDNGPLSVEDALDFAQQIALGVEAAHDAGVIHRDLKPANIKITPEGQIKVLDFGLARADDANTSGSSSGDEPTLTTPVMHSPSIPGAILGTAPYMSPEQARGRRVDKRTDIWSFGVILYEMLTGVSPFHGETATDSIGAVLHKDLDLAQLPPGTPNSVRHVLMRCLERDKSKRYRDIGDVRIELLRKDAPQESAGSKSRVNLPALLAILPLVAAIAAAIGWFAKPAPTTPTAQPVRLTLPIPWGWDRWWFHAFSPDGQLIALMILEQEQPERLWSIYTRRLDESEFRKIYTTRRRPVRMDFTPDGLDLLVGTTGEPDRDYLHRVPVDGGRPVPLLDVHTDDFRIGGPESVWLNDDELVLQSEIGENELFAVSMRDGSSREIYRVDEEGTAFVRISSVTPGGKFALLTSLEIIDGKPTARTIAANLETGEKHEVLVRALSASCVGDDVLVFQRDDTMYAVRFDPETATVSGALHPLPDDLVNWSQSAGAGHVAFTKRRDELGTLAQIDRDGAISELSQTRRWFDAESLMASPDGKWLALSYANEKGGTRETIACLELATGRMQTVTREIAGSGGWSPDGRLIFIRLSEEGLGSGNEGVFDIMEWRPDEGARVLSDNLTLPLGQWSIAPAHNTLLMRWRFTEEDRPDEAGQGDLDILQTLNYTDPDAEWVNYHTTGASEIDASVSPDGEFLAFVSDVTGTPEVYLTPFEPGRPASPVRVSNSFTWRPFWSLDSRTLYYFTRRSDGLDQQVMAVTIDDTNALTLSEPERILFGDQYDDSRLAPLEGGESFAFIDTPDRRPEDEHLQIILNWRDEVRRIVREGEQR